MLDIISILSCLSQVLEGSASRQLKCVVEALLCMTGRVSMLGISRWAEEGGSYRSIQRFFNQMLQWSEIHWQLISSHLLAKDDIYFVAGDTTTVTKSGKETHGLGKFYSSIYGKAVPGVSFLCLSLVSVKRRVSYPIVLEQLIKDAPLVNHITESASDKKGRGRPKGNPNKAQKEKVLSVCQKKVQEHLPRLLGLIGNRLSLTYFVYDGEFGNPESVQLVRQTGLHLISKLYSNAALYFPNQEPYAGKGAPKKYGKKIDYTALPETDLKHQSVEKNIRTDIYQMQMRHKSFADLLNVLVLVKTNLNNGKSAHVVLFSSHLDLDWESLLDYYSLRFQIEFNFRDAKQHWGLEDWMNINQRTLHNAAQLSFFMINLSKILLEQVNDEKLKSVLDLKSRYHGIRYMNEALKLIEKNDEPNIKSLLFERMTALGRIHSLHNTA
jgi:putative transposase